MAHNRSSATSDGDADRDRSFAAALIESLPGVVYLYDRTGRFLKWNRHFERVTGYSHDEISRMHPLDFFEPRNHALLSSRIADVFRFGAASVEANVLTKDLRTIPYLFTGHRCQFEGEECLVGMGIDISERVRAERRLSEHLKQLGALHAATTLLQDADAPLERTLTRFVELIPQALRAPALAAASVRYGDVSVTTPRFARTPWTIEQTFTAAGGAEGALEFAYLAQPVENEAPFLPDERHLLTSLSDLLRMYFERRASDQARRDGEALLTMAERVARLGAWRVDLPGLVPTWSHQVWSIHDLPPGFVPIGDRAFEAYVPEDRERLRVAVAACAENGAPFDLELRLRTPTRAAVWVRVIGEADRDERGATTRIQGAIQDITVRRAAQDEARRLSARVTDTLESISDGLVTLDRDWRFTFMNREAERQLGRSRDTLLGRVVWDEYPMTGTVFETAYRRAVEIQQMVEFEAWYEPLGAWFSIRAYPSEQGLAIYFHNITSQREAREQARVSDERFRLLARATNDAIWDWDLQTNALWWSEGIQTSFGYPPDDIPNTIERWSSRIHPDDRARVVDGIHRAIDAGAESWRDEYQFLRHDGATAHVLDRGNIMRDASGRPTRMIGGVTDLTEKKKLESQFLRAQRLESIGTLAGGIAHDLNNVLSPIMMAVSILRSEEAPPDRDSLLDTIETSSRRGSEMLRQVLGFARGIDGQRLPLNLRHVFRDVRKILGETMPRNIDLQFRAPDDLWWLDADSTQIHQVLMNLCLNARDAMPDGGVLRVEAANQVLDEIYSVTLASMSPGRYVVISCSDTGFGMSRETQGRVFEPFFTTKEVGKGTGLGLSTVLTIVKSHNGRVELYSEPGVGTTFRVYLPAEGAAEAPESLPDDAPPPPRAAGELVLIVDDEENIRAMARKALERHGYTVLEATHGAEAVAIYAQHRDIAVVLTDIAMPVMDGFAMLVALRAVDPQVRVIASSGHAAPDAQRRAGDVAVEHFIAKPYTADALLRTIHEVLHGRL